ncbi:MAG: hypothetical protein WBP86_01020, partial [Thiobacillaceae bacterium]
AIAAVVGGVAVVDHAMSNTTASYAMKGKPLTDPARLDWAGLSSQTELARGDAPAYIGTSLTEAQTQNGADKPELSK